MANGPNSKRKVHQEVQRRDPALRAPYAYDAVMVAGRFDETRQLGRTGQVHLPRLPQDQRPA